MTRTRQRRHAIHQLLSAIDRENRRQCDSVLGGNFIDILDDSAADLRDWRFIPDPDDPGDFAPLSSIELSFSRQL